MNWEYCHQDLVSHLLSRCVLYFSDAALAVTSHDDPCKSFVNKAREETVKHVHLHRCLSLIVEKDVAAIALPRGSAQRDFCNEFAHAGSRVHDAKLEDAMLENLKSLLTVSDAREGWKERVMDVAPRLLKVLKDYPSAISGPVDKLLIDDKIREFQERAVMPEEEPLKEVLNEAIQRAYEAPVTGARVMTEQRVPPIGPAVPPSTGYNAYAQMPPMGGDSPGLSAPSRMSRMQQNFQPELPRSVHRQTQPGLAAQSYPPQAQVYSIPQRYFGGQMQAQGFYYGAPGAQQPVAGPLTGADYPGGLILSPPNQPYSLSGFYPNY